MLPSTKLKRSSLCKACALAFSKPVSYTDPLKYISNDLEEGYWVINLHNMVLEIDYLSSKTLVT